MRDHTHRHGRPERSDLASQVARLRWMVIALAAAWVGTVAFVAAGGERPHDVLTVERLEIVEPDGTLAFVLASSAHPEAATIDGQVIMEGQEEERRNPSFIFFDGKGDEVGGMLFLNEEREDGFQAVRHLSLDGYKQDQTVVLHHYQNPQGSSSGLSVRNVPDRSILEIQDELGLRRGAPREEMMPVIMGLTEDQRREYFGVPRLFVGSDRRDRAALVLRDGEGRERIVLGAPAADEPFIRILDAEGNVVLSLPE